MKIITYEENNAKISFEAETMQEAYFLGIMVEKAEKPEDLMVTFNEDSMKVDFFTCDIIAILAKRTIP